MDETLTRKRAMKPQSDLHGILQPTATVVAALIGLVGVLVTAYVSFQVGSRSSTSEVDDLLARKDARIAELTRMVEEREATITELRAAGSKPLVNMPADRPNPQPSQPTTVSEAPGLKVELLPCGLAGDEFKCEFKATSTDQDKTIYLRSARLIEGDGSELRPTLMQFAGSVSRGDHSPGTGKQVWAEMVRGTPIRGSVIFVGVKPELVREGIPLIELRFDGLAAQFRGVRPE